MIPNISDNSLIYTAVYTTKHRTIRDINEVALKKYSASDY